MFNMSELWNVHPYYGHIQSWRRLLEKIKKEIKEIWNQNRVVNLHWYWIQKRYWNEFNIIFESKIY